ncbi:putative glucan 1,3-beta-glucosidase A [Senna tora]|uniref:Putative glucan 1,3-beta-glucosidase A n=1 Tax=Senna tora TaxID=362788 RepID=A0A834TEC5_9FABA|nr:putative glucan 1,3-beta-glucosidase A [Senna tora]
MGNLRIWVLRLFVFGIIANLLPISESSPSHMHLQKKAKVEAKTEAVSTKSGFKVRGTNLGGWLVVEGWILEPDFFNDIPNGNFTDGTVLQFMSVTTQKYLCANSGGGDFIVANCNETCGWENFRLWRLNETTFRIRVPLPNEQFVGLDGTQVVAVVNNATKSATFEIIKQSNDSNRVRIKASNGFFLQAKSETEVTADVSEVSGWENNDPTVFNLTMVSQIQGDFQVQNGYGAQASSIMKEHYDTFIVENDFKYMNESGVNAVRIPVGWWTAYDPNPPFPFVSGTLQALDNAFSWAQKYGLKVILDLHAAPGSQNGVAHSATRDGSLEWGKSYETIQQSLEVIDFFAARYGKHESLYGIELLNEPLYPYVILPTLEEYSKAAYDVVRKYNPTVYVILSVRLSFTEADVPSLEELVPLANTLENAVIDVHWYSLYYNIFTNLTAQQEIEYILVNRTQQMNQLLDNSGSALIYIGEWSCGWDVENATEKELKDFANAQIEVYDKATFGWSFWTWKNVQQNNWSLKWLIQNGYINLLNN